jgi:hypothetical protein
MYDRYSGAWDRRTEAPEQVALKPQPDPQHLTPDPDPNNTGFTPMWVNSAGAPLLPEEIEAATRARQLATGLGPVDNTPESHFYGRGVGPGLTTLEAQDVMGPYHEDDQGAVAAHAYVAMVDRDDAPGSPHADLTFGEPGNGASPESLRMLETGVGAPYDKGLSREGRWFRRWRNRTIDMHRYPVDMRPLTPRTAYIAPNQPAMSNDRRTQIDSPFATAATYHAGPSDSFVQQVVRRQPRNWADPLSTDGTRDEAGLAAQSYGLRNYGL